MARGDALVVYGFGCWVMLTMSTGAAAVSVRTAAALVVVVTRNAVFVRWVPAGNARVWEDALRPVGDLRSVWRRG